MNSKNLITVATAYEPCNCDDHIRHNNGGNYHKEWELSFHKRKGTFYFLDANTCELIDFEDEQITNDEFHQRLENFQQVEKEGWLVNINWELIEKLKNLDIEIIRRRARDILNKTAKKEDILTCATVLGAKLF